MNLLIMGQNYHLIHHLWPSIPWFEYKSAYEKTKPLLDQKGSPQRMGIFESKKDGFNFLYDIFLGIRSHRKSRSKMRFFARALPNNILRKRYIQLIHKTAINSHTKFK